MRWFLRSKIHKAQVIKTDLNYVGSIGVDKALVKRAGLMAGEKVLVVDNTNGSRIETYIIEEKEYSGKVIIYGAAARLIKKGDEIIIMGFELANKTIRPKNILVDKKNKFIKYLL